jgi:hypothetical protein
MQAQAVVDERQKVVTPAPTARRKLTSADVARAANAGNKAYEFFVKHGKLPVTK